MEMKVALITGASRGLGRTLALRLARCSYTVIINYCSAEAEAEDVARLAGGNACALRADVSDRGQVRAMANEIMTRYGRLDLVINNAGISKDNLLLRQSGKEWDLIIGTNLTGCFNIIGTMSPLVIQSGGGHIMNIASRSGLRGKAGQPAYSASKAGLLGLTLTAARELAAGNIRVNGIMPGYLATDMGSQAGSAQRDAQEQSLLKTLSSDQEIADFVVFLAGTETITGQIFSLDSRIG
ncbi:MAG: SDR family oxidoreductase [Nitrospirae bacterium]|nr:MAG: SDR family oxidoreductase [Nitrospirota bacterium]